MTTPILQLDEWASGQAQPHVTVNEAMRWLECFAQLSVFSMTTDTPPPSPGDGAAYIVPQDATGAWSGQGGKIALYLSNAWGFRTAPPGSIAYVQDEAAHFTFMANDSPPTWQPL